MKNAFKKMSIALLLSFSALVLLVSPVFGATEDFTSYTEVDPQSAITLSEDDITFSSLNNDNNSYVYYDYGADYFGNISQRFNFQISDHTGNHNTVIWGLTNSVSVAYPQYDTSECIMLSELDGTHIRVWLASTYNNQSDGDHIDHQDDICEYGETYYVQVVRSIDGTLSASFYSDNYITLIETMSVDLYGSPDNWRYLQMLSTYDLGEAGVSATGVVSDLDLDADVPDLSPIVVTYPSIDYPDGAHMIGEVIEDYSTIQSVGFEFGTESGVYTDNYTTTLQSTDYFTATASIDDLTNGETYYFRAWAVNEYSIGYGTEKSFVWEGQTVTITTQNLISTEAVSGDYVATFQVVAYPPATDNVSGHLSSVADFSSELDLKLLNLDAPSGTYTYATWNGTAGDILSANSTYYYRGEAGVGSTIYRSQTKSFTTAPKTLRDLPEVDIISVVDLTGTGNWASSIYVFEVTAKLTTTNTTDWIYNQGFEFGEIISEYNTLLPPLYSYGGITLQTNNTFTSTYSLSKDYWDAGTKIYIHAWADTAQYDRIYSNLVSFILGQTEDEEGTGTTSGTGADGTTTIDETFTNAQVSLGLTGTFGTWAFMSALILVISLIFGICIVSSDNNRVKSALGVSWLLAIVAIVGGFIFSGKLGIWPVIIMVGGVVILVMIAISMKFSGGGNENG